MDQRKRHQEDELPSVEFLVESIRLDPESGFLYWKVRPRHHFLTEQQWLIFNATKPNKRADIGSFLATKYRRVRMNYRTKRIAIAAHRIVFAIANGSWPRHDVDHINRDRTDNRPCNLRDVTHSENMQNLPPRIKRSAQPA